MFDSHQQPVSQNHTGTVALLTAAFVFIPALVLFSQPVTYWPAICAGALCVILAFFNSRTMHKALVASPVIAPPVTGFKAAK